jgi:hypothetical protein
VNSEEKVFVCVGFLKESISLEVAEDNVSEEKLSVTFSDVSL